jgi:hypothetical protein
MNSANAVLDESNDEYRAFASGVLTAQDCDERPLCADIVAKVCRLTSFKFLAVEVSIEKMRGGHAVYAISRRVDHGRVIRTYRSVELVDACNGRDVADEIEVEFLIKGCVNRVTRSDNKQRVAVRGRAHDRLGADIGVGPRPVLNDEWLAQPLREPLTDQVREDAGVPASGKADDDAYQPRRIGLRARNPRCGRKSGSARCQMQKSTARKLPSP